MTAGCVNFNCRVVLPRLHEEIAVLRRDLGGAEELLDEVVDFGHRLPADLESRIYAYFGHKEPDMTAADIHEMEVETWPQLEDGDVPGLPE